MSAQPIFTSMLSYSQAYYGSVNKLQALYDTREATAIAHELMQHITGLDKLQRLVDKDKLLPILQQEQYETKLAELLKGRPLQYVVGHAWFLGREYMVNEQVLIPRPETEELVQMVIDEWEDKRNAPSILDIGTGSGCIPIALKLALPNASVSSCDISEGALNVAKENAQKPGAEIEFIRSDILDKTKWNAFGRYDIIVSNPPYITLAEKVAMHKNVRDHEPATALFVTDNDPLQFYKAIAAFGKKHLNEGGNVYCELHRAYALETQKVFEAMGYREVEIRKDMNGNWRMLRADLST